MQANRRSFVAGALAACMVAGGAGAPARGATQAIRRYELFRGADPIGRQTVTVSRSESRVTVDVEVEIAVRIVGVPVYRYRLSSREVWDGGRLTALEATTDDNGSPQSASATRGPNGLAVKGSGYSGIVDGNPGTTTYWTPAFLQRPVWISTQDGQPLAVSPRRGGAEAFATPGGEVRATRWRVGGDLAELNLFYDGSGEWVGSEFQARGDTVRIAVLDPGTALAPFWVDPA